MFSFELQIFGNRFLILSYYRLSLSEASQAERYDGYR